MEKILEKRMEKNIRKKNGKNIRSINSKQLLEVINSKKTLKNIFIIFLCIFYNYFRIVVFGEFFCSSFF